MRPKNATAKNLIEQLALLKIKYSTGYFGGSTYCIGVEVENHAEAVKLGMRVIYHGDVGFDAGASRGTCRAIIAFRDALVSA